MDTQIDRRIFELDLAAAILELELGADAHEIAYGRVREDVEALRLETGFVAQAFDPLPARVRFRISADCSASLQSRQERLVIDTTAHERPLGLGGIGGLLRNTVRCCNENQYRQKYQATHNGSVFHERLVRSMEKMSPLMRSVR